MCVCVCVCVREREREDLLIGNREGLNKVFSLAESEGQDRLISCSLSGNQISFRFAIPWRTGQKRPR